jgi:hypothetical protein
MASYSDDEHNANLHETEAVKQKRRDSESRDDAWVDILIGSQTRRKLALNVLTLKKLNTRCYLHRFFSHEFSYDPPVPTFMSHIINLRNFVVFLSHISAL